MASVSVKISTTVLKALKILEVIANAGEPISLADVAAETELDRSTTYRLLGTLETAGYLVRDRDGKKYQLSFKVVTLGRNLMKQDKRSELIGEALRELADRTGETANYAAIESDEMVLISQAKGNQILSVDFNVGDRSALHCTAIGKAVLAFLDTAYIEEIIARGLPRMARNTITDPDAFRSEMARVRAQGYAIDDAEFSDELRCIGAPIFDGDGRPIGGINFSGPRHRFNDEKLAALRSALMASTQELTYKLNGLNVYR